MSFKNPIYYKLQKLDKKYQQEENIETIEKVNEVENQNIISLDEIMNTKEEIELIDFPRFIVLTSGPRVLPMNPNKLAELSINYDKASTNFVSKSI